MNIRMLGKSEHQKWDDFIRRSGEGTFFHLTGWIEALEGTFKLKQKYIYAEKNGEIAGICPLFLVKDMINGIRVISIPIGVYGGIVANDSEVFTALHQKSIEMAVENKARFIEYRFMESNNNEKIAKEVIKKNSHVTFIKELPLNKEECLAQVPRKARADIRKATKSGMRMAEGDEFLKDCYNIYAANQRNLGSPVFHYRWMKKLKETFKDNCVIHLVFLGKKPIAGALSFVFKDQILPFYGASLKEYSRYHPDGFMYLALQEWAVERGIRYFDFGRSKIDSGSYHFKKNQGFEPKKLDYIVYPVEKGLRIPNKPSKLLLYVSNIWKKMPTGIATSFGPALYPYVLP